MKPYHFIVPEQKKIRVIVYTDWKNEADDQLALVHWLMTPMADVQGIIAGHFDRRLDGADQTHDTVQRSYDEIMTILALMELEGKYPVYLGSDEPMSGEQMPIVSDGARFIIQEALRDDARPLFIACQGSITDLASAVLLEPEICCRMTCIWIGGAAWPNGGWEFNIWQDIHAANVVFSSRMPVWQVPMDVYKQFRVSLAELEYKVYPCGEIGRYLFEQMAELNERLGGRPGWPHGEMWELGDQGSLAVLLQDHTFGFEMKPAPRIASDGSYIHRQIDKNIRVYHTVDVRLTLEDFFSKLALNAGFSS